MLSHTMWHMATVLANEGHETLQIAANPAFTIIVVIITARMVHECSCAVKLQSAANSNKPSQYRDGVHECGLVAQWSCNVLQIATLVQQDHNKYNMATQSAHEGHKQLDSHSHWHVHRNRQNQ